MYACVQVCVKIAATEATAQRIIAIGMKYLDSKPDLHNAEKQTTLFLRPNVQSKRISILAGDINDRSLK